MTQAQRKKALADAEARLAEADEALKAARNAREEAACAVRAAQDDLKRNEPLTKAQAEALALILKWGTLRYRTNGRDYFIQSDSKPLKVRSLVVSGLESRHLLKQAPTESSWYRAYALSDWGKEVAESLAKASKPASEEGRAGGGPITTEGEG